MIFFFFLLFRSLTLTSLGPRHMLLIKPAHTNLALRVLQSQAEPPGLSFKPSMHHPAGDIQSTASPFSHTPPPVRGSPQNPFHLPSAIKSFFWFPNILNLMFCQKLNGLLVKLNHMWNEILKVLFFPSMLMSIISGLLFNPCPITGFSTI